MKEREKGRERERELGGGGCPMGPDIHSTDSDRYDSKESGLWYIYKGRQQSRYYLTACNAVPITLDVRCVNIPSDLPNVLGTFLKLY